MNNEDWRTTDISTCRWSTLGPPMKVEDSVSMEELYQAFKERFIEEQIEEERDLKRLEMKHVKQ